jgi:hypothetical protein
MLISYLRTHIAQTEAAFNFRLPDRYYPALAVRNGWAPVKWRTDLAGSVIDPFLREVNPTEAVKPSRQFQRCVSIHDRIANLFSLSAQPPHCEGLRNASIQ